MCRVFSLRLPPRIARRSPKRGVHIYGMRLPLVPSSRRFPSLFRASFQRYRPSFNPRCRMSRATPSVASFTKRGPTATTTRWSEHEGQEKRTQARHGQPDQDRKLLPNQGLPIVPFGLVDIGQFEHEKQAKPDQQEHQEPADNQPQFLVRSRQGRVIKFAWIISRHRFTRNKAVGQGRPGSFDTRQPPPRHFRPELESTV